MNTATRPAPPSRAAVRLRRVLACAASVGLVLVGLAGCGSGGSGGSAADPASVVPASAALYAAATVRPVGAQKTAALAAGRALTHQSDPYLRLLAALQTPGSPQLNFKRDVAPWLGPRAGVFLESLNSSASALLSLVEQGLLGGSTAGAFPFGHGGAQGAIVLDTSDAGKARAFLDTQAKRAGAHATSYRGVSYQATGGGLAFAVVHRLAVVGSESGVHGVIDTALGAGALAHAGDYVKLTAAAPAGALAHLYVAPSAKEPGGSRSTGTSGLLALLTGAHQANVSLVASAGSLTLDADTLQSATASAGAGLLGADPQGVQALSELPGEAWLAIGFGHFGSNLSTDVQALRSLTSLGGTLEGSGPESSAGLSFGGLLGALTSPLDVLGANNAQARRDFASWMGSAGIFASGAALLELRGAVVIESNKPTQSRAAVAKLAAALRKDGASVANVSIAGTEAAVSTRIPGLPVALDIADGQDAAGRTKFVLGIGEASVGEALNPSSTLSTADAYTAAANSLGEGVQPGLMVNFPTLLSLLEGVGLTESPSVSKVVPYLRSTTTLVGGGRTVGSGVERFKLVLGLQSSG